MLPRLSNANLSGLPRSVAVPRYDRDAVKIGIVHLGLGAFFRAHQALAIDDALGAGELGWGVCAASLRHPDARDAIGPQDGLYALATREAGNERIRVIGAIREALLATEERETLLLWLANPATRLVTLTITEKGYLADIASGALRMDDPLVAHDLANPQKPHSALGFLCEALARRRSAGVAPFTILSCDNLPDNGRLLRRVLIQFAERRDDELARYIAGEVSVPVCMVDRIVPATTPGDRVEFSQKLGVEDRGLVVTEPFFQWVIEDRFSLGRPGFERSGVQFVADVAPYEKMKLRLLNGAHSTIAAIGRLAGLETVAEAIANPDIRRFIAAYWRQTARTLDASIDVGAYTQELLERFGNTALRHRLAQIATDASLKLPQRIVAPLRELREQGAPNDALVFALAVWMRSCGSVDEAGHALPISDPPIEAWANRPDAAFAPTHEVVRAYLGRRAVFADLSRNAGLAVELEAALAEIHTLGMLGAIRERLREGGT